MREIGAVERQPAQEFADGCSDARGSAVAVRQKRQPLDGSGQATPFGQLQREFKRVTGRSPIDYYLRLRVGRACELLRAGDRGVAEVAVDVGFADAGYFARRFRAAMGMSPREYRRLQAALKDGRSR